MPAKDFVTRPQLSTPANDQHCKKLWIHGQIFLHQTTNISKCVLSSKISSLMPWFSKNLGFFYLRDMGWPNVCISLLPGVTCGKVSKRSVCSSHQCFLKFPAALRWQTLATSVTAFETDRKEKTKTRPVILWYCDIGIISQVWAALHAVGNRIMWWEGQSTFCDGKVGGCTSMALALQSLVDFYSNVIYKGKRGNCHVQLFNSWVSWLAV